MDTVLGPKLSEHLLSSDTANTVLVSISSFQRCCRHRYVLDKTRRCLKPVLLLAAAVYLLGLILIVPINIVSFVVHLLSLGTLDTQAVSSVCSRWLVEATSLVPLLSVLVLRSVIRKPLYKCFIHMLREVNPSMAHTIESQPRIRNPNRRTWGQAASTYVSKTMQLLILEFAIYVWKQLPWIGLAAEPIMHFVTMAHALETRRAIVLSGLAFLPYISPVVEQFVHMWRASSVLGEELLEDYVSHIIEHAQRESFFRRRAVTITTFVMPQLLVMRLPVLGPLAVLPMAASAAYLVDVLLRKGEAAAPAAPGSGLKPGQQAVPTVPTGPLPPSGQAAKPAGPQRADWQAGSPHGAPQARSSFEGASAPPWQG